MVGDRWRDVAAGRSAGVRGAILIRYGYDEDLSAEPDVLVGSLLEAADWILSQPGTGRDAVKA
jgi:phosphoglycolate phosphatase-like HAD superfamily hydrolase